MPRHHAQPAIEQRTIKVKDGDNVVVARASGHTWIALLGDDGELVRDQARQPETSFSVPAGTYTVATDGKLASAEARKVVLPPLPGADAAILTLASDAKDQHPVDGVGELAADGRSYATITIGKVDANGEPLRRKSDNDEVFLRSTGGTLQDTNGKQVRSVKLSSGTARFRLVSEPVARIVTVEALGRPPLVGTEIRMEFV